MISTLIKLGLSEKEAKVYLAALELAQDSAQNIAKKAGVNRPTTYVILEKLMKLGLANTLEENKKTLFVAESPGVSPREVMPPIKSQRTPATSHLREFLFYSTNIDMLCLE